MALMRMLAFVPGRGVGEETSPERSPRARAKGPVPASAGTGSTPVAAGAAPVRAPAPEAPGQAAAFEMGDWPALARALKVVGAVKQLAERSELVAWNGRRFDLTVPQESRALADRQYVDRLKAALQEHLGRPVEVAVTVGAVAGQTVAAIAESERRQRQDQANQQMGADPFVQELVSSFDATIESIQPVEKALRS
jgi:DNA polymerase-3 subunit gamma/tau